MTTNSPERMRILIVSPNWIGDAVMAQPMLQLLKQRHQSCVIDVIAPGWVAPVWRAMREVDTVIESTFRHGVLQFRERFRMAKELRKRRYSSAYVLPNTLKFALIPWLAGIGHRVGYLGEMRYGLINEIHRDERTTQRSMVAFYAALAAPPVATAPVSAVLPRPTLLLSQQRITETFLQLGLQSDHPLIAFAPGAEFGAAKRWPATYFARLAGMILERHTDAQIVLLGSGKDKPICEEIAAVEPNVRNFAGVTSLDQAIALLASSKAVVSNDSGLLHIASAFNRPVVAIYGSTDPNHAPPFSDIAKSIYLNLDCAPCKQRECPLGHHHCMRQIIPEMTWESLAPMLDLPPH